MSARRSLSRSTAPTREIDRETEEMLQALGYLAPPEERAAMAGRDPKDGIAVYAKLQEARQLAQVGQWERADVLLGELLTAEPDNVTARNLLALGAVQRHDLAEAERQYQESLARQPRQHRVFGALGAMALRRGDLDRAESLFEDALALAPSYVEAMSNLGVVAARRGDEAGAEAWYRRAIAADPTYPHVHRRLADLFYDRKEYDRALDYYRRAMTVLPRYFEVLIQAGNSARYAGDAGEAKRYYAEAARVRPDSWIPPYNLACLQALGGEPAGAMASLGTAVRLGFTDLALLDANDDFASLRSHPDWPALEAEIRRAALEGRRMHS